MHTDRTIAEQMANFAANCKIEKLASEIVNRVKACIKDAIECCISSESDRRKEGVLKVAKDSGTDCLLWGTSYYGSVENAAFYNGVSGAISSRNDISRIGKAHPGSIVVPTALCLGECLHADGKTVIEAILAGYEIMIRYGNTLRLAGISSSFRGSAMTGSVAATVTAAIMMKLPEEQIAAAISFAVHNSFGLNEWAWAGTGEDVLQNGWCCRNGIQAARLAQAGVPAAMTIFEGECGMLKAFGWEHLSHLLVEELGIRYYIMDIRFKDIAACINVQTAGQAAESMAKMYDITPEEIEDIEIEVAGQSKNWPGCDNTEVKNLVQAIMSIQFTVAQAIVNRDCSNIRWAPPYDATVTALMQKCHITENEEFTNTHYQHQAARITVTLYDGRSITHYQDDVISLTERQAKGRFIKTMMHFYGSMDAYKINGSIDAIENMSDISRLISLLRIKHVKSLLQGEP